MNLIKNLSLKYHFFKEKRCFIFAFLNSTLNSTNLAKNLGEKFGENSAQNSNQNSNPNAQIKHENPAFSSLANYKKLAYKNLSEDEKSEGFVFHILSDFVSEISRQKLKNLAQNLSEIYPCEIEIHICEDDIFRDFPKFRDNYMAYFRLFIPNLLPKSVKIALYLDVDMLCVGDLRALFALDMHEKAAGAILDVEYLRSYLRINKTNSREKPYKFDDLYINSGFLLINLIEYKRCKITQKCLEFLNTYHTGVPDQDALSHALRDCCLILPLKFNALSHLFPPSFTHNEWFKRISLCDENEIKDAIESPIILHFAGDGKPWDCNFWHVDKNGELLGFKWWLMALKTPFFSDDFFAKFMRKKENLMILRDFGLYFGALIYTLSQNLRGYLKMPFVLFKEFENFDFNENYAQKLQNLGISDFDVNLAFELYYNAVKAYTKKRKIDRIWKFVILPYRIYRAKIRCKKGNFRAQRECELHKIYTQNG